MSVAQRLGPDATPRFRRSVHPRQHKPLAPAAGAGDPLHLAEESLPIWQRTEEELGEMNVPPPYWAFAWAGGQALARYLLDNPTLRCRKARARSRLRLGPVAIAAKKAGARSVLAADIDAMALAAIGLNAAANGVAIATTGDDLLGAAARAHSTSFWSATCSTSARWPTRARLSRRRPRRGAPVLVGDPAAQLLPQGSLHASSPSTRVPVTRELEDAEIKRTAVWRVLPGEPRASADGGGGIC